jgi:dihydroorotate dehydrogenase electron transfer subunit
LQEGLTSRVARAIPRTGPSKLVSNRLVGPGWYVLRLREPAIARAAEPGQFVQILCSAETSFDPLLRRPFSIYQTDPASGTYDILYTPIGRGTRWMAALPAEPGAGVLETADVIGPFGNTFTPPGAGDRVLLVGGGVGVAPLYFLARKLKGSSPAPEITLCMGARTAAQLQGLEDFRALGVACEVATDDGTQGHPGFVTDLLGVLLDGGSLSPPRSGARSAAGELKIYGCGPSGMNEALRRIAVKRGIWCEICLESTMACGFGICFACVLPIRKELDGPFYNRRICWEGPVFDARLIKGNDEKSIDKEARKPGKE